jgi:Fe2+ or Zn2+ uptake regulation protein
MTRCILSHHPLPDLRSLGFRRTPQRRLVWEVLHHLGPYLTAEEIYQAVQKQSPDFNRTTVYRNLASLRDMGLVQEMHAGKGPCRYVTSVDYQGGPQFVCEACGTVVEVPDSSLSQQIEKLAEANGFVSRQGTDIVVYARCRRCVAAEEANAGALVMQEAR